MVSLPRHASDNGDLPQVQDNAQLDLEAKGMSPDVSLHGPFAHAALIRPFVSAIRLRDMRRTSPASPPSSRPSGMDT